MYMKKKKKKLSITKNHKIKKNIYTLFDGVSLKRLRSLLSYF